MYQFQKKDGSLVDFDQNKIVTGIVKAGGTAEEAQLVATQVMAWLPTVVVNDVVKAYDVRTKVISELQTINPIVATSFESYIKA